ncbi:hypothetical protein AMJ83_02015 [candidate division WOR_3 bacterium SM23_42]|uniref:Methyltransferase type 11 domain-containing protein n=1 Tax=candidate division WOR_3 bacterium SM23_42 TaxID=1703779 RepID=A0A0S8FXT0_UNCW3|nr:MAG: hypothetical protein AMJ83_02015 [candidate division WOR_3 bacterium SM23_42]
MTKVRCGRNYLGHPFYEFLRQCNQTPLERTILDCGAGSDPCRPPPLFLFYQHGYKTYGLEIEEDALAGANKFCRENDIPLNIFRGDMRTIPFANGAFSFVYSFNAVSFMPKTGIALAMREIERVLKHSGLCFVNFLSVDDPNSRPFCDTSFARRFLRSERHAHHEDNEADIYFANFEILRKEKRLIEKLYHGERIRQAYIGYIAKKKV